MSIRDSDIGKVHNQVKSPWFTEGVSPDGRVPAITHDGFPIFETSAILLYLADQFDTGRKFSRAPSDSKAYSTEVQWLFFAVSTSNPTRSISPTG